MTLRVQRHPRNRLLAVGALAAFTFGCNGTIMDGPGGSGRGTGPGSGPGSGPGAPGSNGGNGEPSNPILPQPPGAAACTSKEFTPARVWRLSDEQYVAAVKDLLPGVAVPTILTPGRSAQQFVEFAELFEIGAATASDVRNSANAAAADAVKNLDGLLACKGGEAPAACAGRFIDGFASRAFRRPLEQVERDGLKAVYDAGAVVNQAEGIRMVVTAVLQSGSFLYRTELGKSNTVAAGQTIELTNHELASSLSFLFLNSIPDAELRAAADDGSLAKAEVFKAQVERLLKSPRVQDNLTTVFQKWMGLGLGLNADLATQEKEFVPALKASMEEETRLFFKQLVADGGTVKDLLTSNKGFVDKVLATHLGVPAPAGTGFQPATYPAGERSGVLTLSGVVARYSLGHPEVFRGKFVRDEFLCTEIPPPGDNPEIEQEVKASENLPVREQVKRRLAHATCGACHHEHGSHRPGVLQLRCARPVQDHGRQRRPHRLQRRAEGGRRCRRSAEGRPGTGQPPVRQREGSHVCGDQAARLRPRSLDFTRGGRGHRPLRDPEDRRLRHPRGRQTFRLDGGGGVQLSIPLSYGR